MWSEDSSNVWTNILGMGFAKLSFSLISVKSNNHRMVLWGPNVWNSLLEIVKQKTGANISVDIPAAPIGIRHCRGWVLLSASLPTLTWARRDAFCPAVTRMACWATVAGVDANWPPELEPPCFPEPCAGWPTRNVPWGQAGFKDRVEIQQHITFEWIKPSGMVKV